MEASMQVQDQSAKLQMAEGLQIGGEMEGVQNEGSTHGGVQGVGQSVVQGVGLPESDSDKRVAELIAEAIQAGSDFEEEDLARSRLLNVTHVSIPQGPRETVGRAVAGVMQLGLESLRKAIKTEVEPIEEQIAQRENAAPIREAVRKEAARIGQIIRENPGAFPSFTVSERLEGQLEKLVTVRYGTEMVAGLTMAEGGHWVTEPAFEAGYLNEVRMAGLTYQLERSLGEDSPHAIVIIAEQKGQLDELAAFYADPVKFTEKGKKIAEAEQKLSDMADKIASDLKSGSVQLENFGEFDQTPESVKRFVYLPSHGEAVIGYVGGKLVECESLKNLHRQQQEEFFAEASKLLKGGDLIGKLLVDFDHKQKQIEQVLGRSS